MPVTERLGAGAATAESCLTGKRPLTKGSFAGNPVRARVSHLGLSARPWAIGPLRTLSLSPVLNSAVISDLADRATGPLIRR
jgi:hypothetical protein